MKLRVISDLHLEFDDNIKLPAVPADAVVLAGDISEGVRGAEWAMREFPDTPVIMTLGNHEFYHNGIPDLIQKIKRKTEGSNVHLLENESINISGVTFFGATLWSDFKLFGEDQYIKSANIAAETLPDFRQPNEKKQEGLIRLNEKSDRYPIYLMPYDAMEMHDTSFDILKNTIKDIDSPIVVVTHYAPSTHSIAEKYRRNYKTAAFVSNHDEFISDSNISVWIHGHTHSRFDYKLGDTRVVCNPRGYAGLDDENGFDPKLIVEVKE